MRTARQLNRLVTDRHHCCLIPSTDLVLSPTFCCSCIIILALHLRYSGFIIIIPNNQVVGITHSIILKLHSRRLGTPMQPSPSHVSQLSSLRRKQFSNTILRQTLNSIRKGKQLHRQFDPLFFNLRAQCPLLFNSSGNRQKPKDFVTATVPQTKSPQKKKEVFNKTFNRTKTDFAHNFVGRKYYLQIQEERKSTSSPQPIPFKRHCVKHQSSSFLDSRQNCIQENLDQTLHSQGNPERAQSCPKANYRYKNNLRFKRKTFCRKVEKLKSVQEQQPVHHNSQITPWEILGNNSWLNLG